MALLAISQCLSISKLQKHNVHLRKKSILGGAIPVFPPLLTLGIKKKENCLNCIGMLCKNTMKYASLVQCN